MLSSGSGSNRWRLAQPFANPFRALFKKVRVILSFLLNLLHVFLIQSRMLSVTQRLKIHSLRKQRETRIQALLLCLLTMSGHSHLAENVTGESFIGLTSACHRGSIQPLFTDVNSIGQKTSTLSDAFLTWKTTDLQGKGSWSCVNFPCGARTLIL